MVASVTFASHRDTPLFPRHDSCFVCPHVHPSFRHLSRVKETMKECSVDCCAESVFHGVKFTQHRPRLVKRVQHSVCANNTAWKLAGVAVSKAVQTICSHGSKPSSNQDQSTGGARVAFVRGCINQFDIHVVQRACREGLAFQRGLLPRALCEEHKTIIEFSRRLVSPFDIHHITRLAFS